VLKTIIKSFLGAILLFATLSSLGFAIENERPNILWLTAEDANVYWFGCYDNDHATTPNIDRLAREGFRYMHTFANAAVCAPARSTWITGLHALSMGTHPMRSRNAIPHDKIRYYADFLREAGYHTSNYHKMDYNIGGRPDNDCWDSTENYGWRTRAEGQPFFTVINVPGSHESAALGDATNTRHDPATFKLREYHPDLPAIRMSYAKYQDAVQTMDANVGEVLRQLETDGLADDTIVFFVTDHGGVMPRSKRFLYDSGTHVPFIARVPEKFRHLWPAEKPGETVGRIISFVDMPKTWLSLAGAEIPGVMQGKVFLGPGDEGPREYHFSFRGRAGYRLDNVRAVRDQQYLYIKNYMPYFPTGQHLDYVARIAGSPAWEAHHKAGKTDAITGRFFEPKPDVEELYDTHADPDNVRNLAGDPAYAKILRERREALRRWQLEIHDSALMPESEMVRQAAASGLTIYEMVRDPDLYPLASYLDAADLALSKDPANEAALAVMLKNDKYIGMRYWGVSGLLMLDQPTGESLEACKKALEDESHEVRAMAAWALIRHGDREAGRQCLINLVRENSYATLMALGIIDRREDDLAAYLPALEATPMKGQEERLRNYLLHGCPEAERFARQQNSIVVRVADGTYTTIETFRFDVSGTVVIGNHDTDGFVIADAVR
jgi:N-sulfoglucosamine sulfohydrolase